MGLGADGVMDPRVDIRRTGELTRDLRSEIRAWLVEAFALEEDTTLWSRVDWHILVWIGQELVSHAEVVERVVSVGNREMAVGGMGGVVTKPVWRNRGLATLCVEAARNFICGELDLAYGLLMCDKSVVPFYERLGWTVVAGPLYYDQPDGKVIFEDVLMVFPCRGQVWPAGSIDVQGPPW